jgi:hypothetical protein
MRENVGNEANRGDGMRTRPAKIGCGAIGVLLGSTAVAYVGGAMVPGITTIALVFLLVSNFLLWAGLLAFLEGQKEDVVNCQLSIVNCHCQSSS